MIDLNDAPTERARQPRYDLELVVQRLRDTAADWAPRLFPNGRRVGDEWRLANIAGDAPRNTGSCVIALNGPHAGDWHDFDGNQGGGPISTIQQAVGGVGRELIVRAAELAGVAPGPPEREAPTNAPQKPPDKDASREISFILGGAAPLAGTLAESYLASRGLSAPVDADLCFHRDLTHWETKTGYPALIGVIRDRSGEICGLHRTYLDEHQGCVGKAAVAKPRMMLGRSADGAVRLAPLAAGVALGVCEGIESGLAVMAACRGLPVWAALSTSGLEQVQLPADTTRVIILADNDASGAGLRAAQALASRLKFEGRRAVIALPPRVGDDFNDVLANDGADAVRGIVEDALRLEECECTEAAAASTPDAEQPLGRHLPLNFVEANTAPSVMRADEGDLARAVAKAWALLLASNRTPWLFRYAGAPTWVAPDDEGRPVAAIVTEERLRHMLSKLGAWRRLNSKGELVPTHPPTLLVKSLLATPDPGLPVLVGIVNTPVFGRGGALLTSPGYHPDARLLYCPASGFSVPAIPPRPSMDDRAAARGLLCEDLLGDFPFASAPERAHALALLLVGFVRAMIDGPTPLHLIEKPTPGTGATLMVDAIATILTGSGASVMTEGRDDEEWRKRVTAKLRQIPSILLIDNLRQKLDSSAVAAALTAPFWEDRILGASEMARLPIRCVWIATGNNPEFSNEMARRLVRIRLDAHVERPWQRDGFRHPDLMNWVRANRARLVSACLTLCQAWIAAGRPLGSRTIGSYENWAQVIGGVLEVAGVEGFLGNLDEMMEASDAEGNAWSAFVSAWWDRFGTTFVATADLFEIALGLEPTLPLGAGNDKSQRTRLGKALSSMRDRVFRVGSLSVRLSSGGKYQGAGRWRLQFQGSANDDAGDLVNVGKVGERASDNVHETRSNEINALEALGERRERRERFSDPHAYAHTRTHAHTIETSEQRSRRSPRPQDEESSGVCTGEREASAPDDVHQRSRDAAPSWLTELDP